MFGSSRVLLLKPNYLEKGLFVAALYVQLISVFQCSEGVDCAYKNVSTLYDIFKKKWLKKMLIAKVEEKCLASKFSD